jgi:hypothetical protein
VLHWYPWVIFAGRGRRRGRLGGRGRRVDAPPGCRLGGLFFWRGGETAGGHVNMFFFCQVGDYTYQLASVKKGHAVRLC